MDSPIFGSQRPHQNHKISRATQQNSNTSDFNSSDWLISNKPHSNFGNHQISTQLKMAYAVLVLQKNIKTLLSKMTKCINKKKNQAFNSIQGVGQRQLPLSHKNLKQQRSQRQFINNPELRPLTVICLNKTNQKLQNICRVINRLKFKKMTRAWSRLYILNEKSHISASQVTLSQLMVNQKLMKDSQFEINSKVQTRRNLNSKKYAKQMKQNSSLNQTFSDYEMQNQKIALELQSDEYNLERFSQKINNLLTYHESRFGADSDRQTWLSDNGISQSSLQNNNKVSHGTKSQVYSKKK